MELFTFEIRWWMRESVEAHETNFRWKLHNSLVRTQFFFLFHPSLFLSLSLTLSLSLVRATLYVYILTSNPILPNRPSFIHDNETQRQAAPVPISTSFSRTITNATATATSEYFARGNVLIAKRNTMTHKSTLKMFRFRNNSIAYELLFLLFLFCYTSFSGI